MENRVSQFVSINEKKGTPDNPLVSIITPILNGVKYLEAKDIQCKTLFGSLPTQHKAFKFLGYEYGQFPVAEYVGGNGLHFGVHQYLNNDDLLYIKDALKGYFK